MATFTPSSEDVRIYEIAILAPYPLPQKEEQTLWKEVEKLFEEVSAKVLLKDSWGQRGLAYKVEGSTEGIFTIYYIEIDPAQIREINRQLSILKNVLRHLVVKPPKHYQFVKYGELFDKWIAENKFAELRQSADKEEKTKKTVLEKAKASARKATTRKKEEESDKPKLSEADISNEVSKLLSSDDAANL